MAKAKDRYGSWIAIVLKNYLQIICMIHVTLEHSWILLCRDGNSSKPLLSNLKSMRSENTDMQDVIPIKTIHVTNTKTTCRLEVVKQ